tara:strand:+ start:2990 stop:4006 length:1017 start_codon:yes stop_codon:yes gene_type:complete
MTPIHQIIKNKATSISPVWFMRQAGRYLPEFREIRKLNPNFINLCLNEKITPEITLQPLNRFDLDAAIIFSDILMVPYGLNQKVEFKKNYGPSLGDLELKKISEIKEDEFNNKLLPVYKAIDIVSKNEITKNKDVIGFVGAPWTILVYMLNKKSPKLEIDINKTILNKFKETELEIFLKIVIKFLKLHIKNQIDNGASLIQIFDSWAGLLSEKLYSRYIFDPTSELVEFTKSLNVPVICFPRNIKNYKRFCDVVKPDVVNIDYDVDPKKISDQIKIPIQGGLDPKILLGDIEQVKSNAIKYLKIFKDHPYIFNLGHGVLPETDPKTIDYLVKLVKDFK